MKLPVAKAVVVGGLLGGALDLAFAVTWAACNGAAPARLFQTIASGLLGEAAYAGGIAAAAVGVACHFALALGWAAAYAVGATCVPWLERRRPVTVIVFGAVVFASMRLVVLPLSAYPRPVTFAPLGTTLDLLSHMFLFAWPIVAAVARANGREASNAMRSASPHGSTRSRIAS